MDPIKLSKPIEAHGEKITELNLQAPTLGALDGIKLKVSGSGTVELDLGDVARLVSGMASIPPSSAKQISVVDAAKLVPAIQGFLSGFLETGKT